MARGVEHDEVAVELGLGFGADGTEGHGSPLGCGDVIDGEVDVGLLGHGAGGSGRRDVVVDTSWR